MEEKEQESVAEETEKSEDLICLFLEKTQSTDSVIRIRWCIDKDVFEDLKTRKVEKPHLLLVVVKWGEDQWHRKEVVRKLIPLEQMMEFIQFKGPGLHKIMTTIVWNIHGNADRLKETFLTSYLRNSYNINVLTYERDKLVKPSKFINADGIDGGGVLEIEVAEGFFAKEPPKWLSKWVNLPFRWKPVDQCDFRKRCILAFSLQPIVIAIWLIGKELITISIGLFLLLCGIRGVNFSPVRRPFTYEIGEVSDKLSGSIFFNKKYPFLAAFTPIFVLTFFIAPLLIIYWMDFDVSTSKIMILSTTAVVSLFLIITVFWGIFWGLIISVEKIFVYGGKVKSRKLRKRRKSKYEIMKERERAERLQKELALQKEYEDLSSVVCTGRRLEPSLAALPKKKRTIHLRFLDLKAKVCKPFAEH